MKLTNCIGYIDYFKASELEGTGLGIEIQDFTQPELLDGNYMERVEAYRTKLRDYKGVISIHGPFLDLKPASPDLEIRRVSVEKYRKALVVAKELGADYIIFHSQINPWINEPFMRKLNNKMHGEFWNSILDEIDYRGIVLIENVFEDKPIYLRELMDEIDRPDVRVCLDIGHSNIGLKSSLDYWIYELRNYIEYVHLHWNTGQYDLHEYPSEEILSHVFHLFKKFKLDPRYAMEYELEDMSKEARRLKKLYNRGEIYD